MWPEALKLHSTSTLYWLFYELTLKKKEIHNDSIASLRVLLGSEQNVIDRTLLKRDNIIIDKKVLGTGWSSSRKQDNEINNSLSKTVLPAS